MEQNHQKGISVIVCCYNSELRLPKTIEYLAKQEIKKDIPVEIIIVNNASTDSTREVAQLEWNKYNTDFLFRIVEEEKPGLTFARKRGIKESQYEYILFCDDDNWLQSDFLQKGFNLIESNPRIGALGGQGIAVSDVDFPDWFSDHRHWYAVGKPADDSGDVSKRGYIWGAAMLTRLDLMKKVFDDNYPFLNQDRTGNQLLSGGDHEICIRILLLRHLLYYDKSLLFYHYIAPNRLTWDYMENLHAGISVSESALKKYHIVYAKMDKSFFRKFLAILNHSFRIIRQRNSDVNEKNDLYAKIACMLKSEKWIKDPDYKNIIRFYLENN